MCISLVSTLKKVWVDAILINLASYTNLGTFYRIPFKSLLREQIKQVTVASPSVLES